MSASLSPSEEFRELLTEFEAVAVVTGQWTMDAKARIQRWASDWSRSSRPRRQDAIVRLRTIVDAFREDFSVKASRAELIEAMSDVRNGAQGLPYAWMSRNRFIALFDDSSRFTHPFRLQVPHARVRFPVEAAPRPYELLIHIAEASLYEDMCSAFNLAKESAAAIDAEGTNKRAIKTMHMYRRTAMTSALSFVEAYVNGLAYDYLVEKGPPEKKEYVKALTEWDFSRNQPRYLSLRAKILQYQKIILGVASPVLQKSNCPELKAVLDAKIARDSIVHASAVPNPKTILKDVVFLNLPMEDVEHVVDNAIELVRKLELLIHGDERRIWWLLRREADGLFPDLAFV